MRCDEKFEDSEVLSDHVKDQHPEAYFPCEHCNILKYSEAGLKFHYTRCTKKPEGFLKEYRKKSAGVSIERTPVSCEFCGNKVGLFSLNRQYNEVHGVVEDKFECSKCGKGFKRRDFWVVHMEIIHRIPLTDMLEEVSKLNVKDRDAIEVKFPKGKRGLKGAERRKALGVSGGGKQKSDDTEGEGTLAKRRKRKSSKGKGRGRPRKKPVPVEEDSEKSEEEEDEEEEDWKHSSENDDDDDNASDNASSKRITKNSPSLMSRSERLSRRLAQRDSEDVEDRETTFGCPSIDDDRVPNQGHSRYDDHSAAVLQIDKRLVIPITPMMTDAEIDALVKTEILSDDEDLGEGVN